MIAAGEPKQGGRIPETGEADGVGYSAKVFGGGKNSIGADQATDLEDEGEEGGEVDYAEGAEEKPTREEAMTVAVLGVERPAEDRWGREVHGRGSNIYI